MTKLLTLAQRTAVALTLSPVMGDLALAAPRADTVRPQIEQLLAEQVNDAGPGVAVLVSRGDELLFRGARGLANVELGVPLSAANRFRIGSVTKQFVVVALLRLVEQGQVGLDDPVAKYLPDFPLGNRIRLRQLLNHTSGITNYTAIPGYMANPVRRDLSTQELIAVFKDLPPDFEPGTSWNYSNSGYVLLGAVIEAVTKKPWGDAVNALLQEVKMACSSSGDDRRVIPLLASGYTTTPEADLAPAAVMSLTQAHAAGAMTSCVDDLWSWNSALHGGKLLSEASYRLMTTPEGEHASKAGFGFGLVRSTVRGEFLLQHGGGIFGYAAMLMALPKERMSVVVLKNTDAGGPNVDQLARRIAAVAFGKPFPGGKPISASSETLHRLAGVYGNESSGGSRVLRVDKGVLTSQHDAHPATRLTPLAGGIWLLEGSLGHYEEIGADASGALQLRFFAEGEGAGEVWTRTAEPPVPVSDVALTAEQVKQLLGKYVGQQLTLRIFLDDAGVLRAQVPGQPAVSLTAEGPLRLVSRELGVALVFADTDEGGRTATLVQGPARILMNRQPN